MKKFFSVMMVVTLLMLAFPFYGPQASAPQQPPPKVYVSSAYIKDLAAGTHIPSQMTYSEGTITISCVVTNVSGQAVCTIPKKYAGQSVVLHLSVGGKILLFYVTVPEVKDEKYSSQT